MVWEWEWEHGQNADDLRALERQVREIAIETLDVQETRRRFGELLRADDHVLEIVARYFADRILEKAPWYAVLRAVGEDTAWPDRSRLAALRQDSLEWREAHAAICRQEQTIRDNVRAVDDLWLTWCQRELYGTAASLDAIENHAIELQQKAEWARSEGPAMWRAQKQREAERAAAEDADPAGMVRYSVEDRLRKNRSKQPSDTAAVAEWFLYEAHQARGPENKVKKLREFEEEMAAAAAKWREWAACWRDLAARLCEHHHCEPKELPPPGSRTREHVSEIEKLQRVSQGGDVVSVSDIDTARTMDKMHDFFAEAAERRDRAVKLGLAEPRVVSFVHSAIAVPKYLEYVETPLLPFRSWSKPCSQQVWDKQVPHYIAGMTAKHAALVAAHLVDVADWLERAAATIESQVKRPKLAAIPRP